MSNYISSDRKIYTLLFNLFKRICRNTKYNRNGLRAIELYAGNMDCTFQHIIEQHATPEEIKILCVAQFKNGRFKAVYQNAVKTFCGLVKEDYRTKQYKYL